MNCYATKSTTYVKELILNQSHAIVHSVYRKTINVVTGDHLFAIQARDSHLSPVSIITSMTGEDMSQLFVVPGMEVLITPKFMIFPTFVLSLEDTAFVDLRLRSVFEMGIKSESEVGGSSESEVGIKSESEMRGRSVSEMGGRSVSEAGIKSESEAGRSPVLELEQKYSLKEDLIHTLKREIGSAIHRSVSGGLDVVFHCCTDTGNVQLTSYQTEEAVQLTSRQNEEKVQFISDSGEEEVEWNIFQKAAAVRLQNAYDLFQKGSFSDSAKELIHLIGLGTGLTPCGDDFICGIFAGFQLLDERRHPFMSALQPMVADHLSDTNIISSSFLKCSMEGQFSAAVNALVEIFMPAASASDMSVRMSALACDMSVSTDGELVDVISAADRHISIMKADEITRMFREIGHSSGFDSLCGIYYAMLLL